MFIACANKVCYFAETSHYYVTNWMLRNSVNKSRCTFSLSSHIAITDSPAIIHGMIYGIMLSGYIATRQPDQGVGVGCGSCRSTTSYTDMEKKKDKSVII